MYDNSYFRNYNTKFCYWIIIDIYIYSKIKIIRGYRY